MPASPSAISVPYRSQISLSPTQRSGEKHVHCTSTRVPSRPGGHYIDTVVSLPADNLGIGGLAAEEVGDEVLELLRAEGVDLAERMPTFDKLLPTCRPRINHTPPTTLQAANEAPKNAGWTEPSIHQKASRRKVAGTEDGHELSEEPPILAAGTHATLSRAPYPCLDNSQPDCSDNTHHDNDPQPAAKQGIEDQQNEVIWKELNDISPLSPGSPADGWRLGGTAIMEQSGDWRKWSKVPVQLLAASRWLLAPFRPAPCPAWYRTARNRLRLHERSKWL